MISYKDFSRKMVIAEAVVSASGVNRDRHFKTYILPYIGSGQYSHVLAKSVPGIEEKSRVTIHSHRLVGDKTHVTISSEHNPDKKVEVLASKLEKPPVAKADPNTKGVMHELLVGKELNKLIGHVSNDGEGHHMSAEAKEMYDKLKNNMNDHEYSEALAKAKSTAKYIHQKHIKSNNPVKSVHWTSKSGDIGRLTGVDESQSVNPADIMIKHHDNTYTGYSLKVLDKKGASAPMKNPGAGTFDKLVGTNLTTHYNKAKSAYNALQTKDKTEDKATELSKKAIIIGRDEMLEKIKHIHTNDPNRFKLLLRHLLHANQTHTPLYKLTTSGSSDDHEIHDEHPFTHHDDAINDLNHFTFEKSGGTSVIVNHKGKKVLKMRIKPAKGHLTSSLKLVME